MSTIGNLLWIIFGGFIIAVEYVIASILMMITIVGIPFGLQTLKMANLALWPFGRDTRSTEFATGCLGTIMNLLWIIVGGFWIFVSHIILGVLLSITIIGIPFGKQHFKLAAFALTPFGREVYNKK
ncbi:MAG TPA: YccF domain-containing protein [Prolixibacteraceae bacterium]|nr:YccF domain-containing protein [Prolixibacteraceae bacterium]